MPPEYFDSGKYKTQSKNQFAGSKGHNQYLQKGVVRFELPYKGICVNCQKSIGRGTRYNAQKVPTGESYFTTPIWEFQMACRNCQHPWKIRTNPQQRGFDYTEGVAIQAGQDEVVDATASVMAAIRDEPATSLDRLETVARGERQTKTEIERLQAIQQLQSQTTLQDASINASIRANFRTDRKIKRLKRHQASKVGWREGMEWLNTSVDDQVAAKEAVFGQPHQEESQRFTKVRKSSIFDSSASSKKRITLRGGPSTLHFSPPETVSSSRSSHNAPGRNVEDEDKSKTRVGQTSKDPCKPALRVKQKIQFSINTSKSVVDASLKNSPCLKIVTKQKDPPTNGLQDMMAAYYGSSESDDGG